MDYFEFIRINGYMYRLTCKAYRAFIRDSIALGKPVKVTRYGTNLGKISSIQLGSDLNMAEIIRINVILTSE